MTTWWISLTAAFTPSGSIVEKEKGQWGRLSLTASSLYQHAPRGVFLDYLQDHPAEVEGFEPVTVLALVELLRRAFPQKMLED